MRYTKNVVEPSILASGRLARAVCAGPGSVKNIDYRVIVRSAKRRDRVTRSRLQHADQALIFRFPVTVPVWSYRPGRLSRSSRSGPPERDALERGIACLVPRLVDQRALLDPRHHVAEFGADVLDRMLGELGAGGLERGLVDLVVQDPVARVLA